MSSETFVPFANALKAGRVPGKPAQEFRPLQSGVPSPSPSSSSSPSLPATPAENHAHAPVIQVIKEEGVVKEIKVQCSCGQVIEISCQY